MLIAAGFFGERPSRIAWLQLRFLFWRDELGGLYEGRLGSRESERGSVFSDT